MLTDCSFSLACVPTNVNFAAIRVAVGSSETTHQNTPFFPVRKILSELLELTSDPLSNRLRLQTLLGPTRWMRLAPFVNDLLNLDCPDFNGLCANMSEEAKVSSVIHFIVQILKMLAANAPILLVFENVQWYVPFTHSVNKWNKLSDEKRNHSLTLPNLRQDSATWEFILEGARTLSNVSFLLETRPLIKPPVEYFHLVKGWSFKVDHIKLAPFDLPSIVEVCLLF